MAIASAAHCAAAAVAITHELYVCSWNGHRARAPPYHGLMAINQARRYAINQLGRQQQASCALRERFELAMDKLAHREDRRHQEVSILEVDPLQTGP
jgi:hypothetical protein